jgi:mRNA interferase MazF
MQPQQGDIVLVPVPFTDLTSQKRRPVIVVSNDAYNQRSADMLVVAMTSNPTKTPFGFQVTAADLVAGTLNRPGIVRADKIYTLAQSIIVTRFGRVSPRIVGHISAITRRDYVSNAVRAE